LVLDLNEIAASELDPPPSTGLSLFALGPGQVYFNGRRLVAADWTFAKPKALLFFLLVYPPQTKEQIGLAFWPDASPQHVRNSLRATLYHLRQALGRPDWIKFDDGRYSFNRTFPYWYDVEIFRQALNEARHNVQSGIAIDHLSQAINLYKGEYLEDATCETWCLPLRETLRREYLDGLMRLGRLMLDEARFSGAADVFRLAIEKDAYLESAHRGLMRCYARLGERAQAIRHYRGLEALLLRELGSSPSARTINLYERLRLGLEE
jgi:DNA-binding SARP family transcriptional activator